MNTKEITIYRPSPCGGEFLDVIPYFYYLRDRLQKPIVTICLLVATETEQKARGIAICSVQDAPNKKVGRAIALGRALKALRTQNTDKRSLIVRNAAFYTLLCVTNPITATRPLLTMEGFTMEGGEQRIQYKSEFEPTLNTYECDLLLTYENHKNQNLSSDGAMAAE